jgi:hypothetical protein
VSRLNTATWLLAGLAAIGHAYVGVFYAASGLVAPLWAVVLLGLWWLVLGVALIVLARRGSWWTPAVPVVAYGTWWLVLTAGERLLGWTA